LQKETLKDLLNVVKGITPPDAVIRNGRLINVFTNSIEENLIIVIKNGFITSVEEDNGRSSYNDIKIIDAEGLYLCPGFIDSHTHLDNTIPFYELVPYAIKGGTTTIITEFTDVGCISGMKGAESFVDSTKGYPLRCYFVVPAVPPPFPKLEGGVGFKFSEFSKLLRRDDFVGVGEGYWTRVIDGDEQILKQSALALSLNKVLDGHAAGARGKRLAEYAVTGITSCHESVNVDEAVEKLKLGIYVMIREGFIRRELKEVSKIKDVDVDKRRLLLVSDSADPVMLYEEGYMDSVVRTAIKYGFSPIEAIKMATINPADYARLRYLGAIAPLRYADILFIKNLKDISIERVMVNGEMVFSDGHFTKTLKPYNYSEEMRHTITIDKVRDEDFRIKADGKERLIRVVHIVNETITREITHKAEIKDGYVMKDLQNDIIPVAVINRRNKHQMGKGFIKGTGVKDGALATSLTWDTGNILVFGSDENDMKVAVNRVIDLQGGIVITQKGSIIYEFPMPVYGVISTGTMEEIWRKTREFEKKLKEIGSTLEKPYLNVQTIPFTGLPFLRITDKGLVDIKNKRLVSLFL
jgi:adenine deaminase